METKYNGWKNRQTWNCALWINNDEGLYNAAVEFVKTRKHKRSLYMRFISYMGMDEDKTPDGIKWISSRTSFRELNAMMAELI